MSKTNYMHAFDAVAAKSAGKRPRLLLHSCCGPCSSSVLELLTKYFDVTLLWYNPNLYPQEEFDRRLATQIELIERQASRRKSRSWPRAGSTRTISAASRASRTSRRVGSAAPNASACG